ncbi:MAG: hypothetical protein ACRELV_02355 [Longimicrobiales bacterium]
MFVARSCPVLAIVVTAATIASCTDAPITGPTSPLESSFASIPGTDPLECPTNQTLSESGTIGLLGGTVAVDGHSITLPFGAVVLPTTITLTVPASNYMEIDIRAGGLEHFTFREPARVVIDYSRCSRNNIEKGPLEAWYWDSGTRTLLEDMDASDDPASSRVSFTTDHLSGYVVAN